MIKQTRKSRPDAIRTNHNDSAGFSILEIVVACSIILVSVFSIMSLAQKSVQFSRLSLNQTQASFLLEEGAEAVKSIRDSGWTNISALTSGLTYYLAWNGNAWSLSTTNDTPTGQFTRTVVLNDVYRSDDTQDIIPPVASALDNTPPAIVVAPTASQVASNHAQIHWMTNERGNSQVRYSTTSHAVNGNGNSPFAFLHSIPAILSAAAGNALSVWNASETGQLHANKLAIAGTYEYSTTLDSTLTTDHTVTLSSLNPSTTYYYRTYSQDAAGNLGTSAEQSFATAPAPDTVAPTVSVTSPTNGSYVSGTITVTATATDDVGVDHVDFYGQNTLLGGDATAPYSITFNTTSYTTANYSFKAIGYDAAGNATTSSLVNVTISNPYYPPYVPPPSDTTPPTASLTAPGAGTLTGTVVVSANAWDDRYVDHVDFYSGGTLIGADASAPYSINWDSSTIANGTTTLFARAFDQTGNYGNSAGVSVTLNNPPPPGDTTAPSVTLTSPTEGNTLTGQVTMSATAIDNVGVTRVEFYYNYAMFDQDTTATNGSQYSVLYWSQQLGNSDYTITAKAYDAAGNFSISSANVHVSNPPQYYYCPGDCTPPDFIYMYAPTTDSTVTGTVPISVNARDNVGIAYVDFYYDGNFIDRDTTSDGSDNFTVNWNTAYLPNSLHGLWANAFDASGNGTTTGASVYVNTSNPDPKAGDGGGKPGSLDPTTYTMIKNIISMGAPIDATIDERLQNILNTDFQIDDTIRAVLKNIIDYGVPLSETNKTIFSSVLNGTPLTKEVYNAVQIMIKSGISLDFTTQQTLQSIINAGQIDELTRATLQYMIDTGAPLEKTTRDTLQCIISVSDGNPKCSPAPTVELYDKTGMKILMNTKSSTLAKLTDYIRSYFYTSAQATGTQTLDQGTKLITITVSWIDNTGTPMNKTLSFYLANIFN